METYVLKHKKKKKIWLIPIIIIAGILAAIYVLGIIVNIGGLNTDTTSAAVVENTQLKQQISDLNTQADTLNQRIAELEAQLAAMPTPAPAAASPTPAAGGDYY